MKISETAYTISKNGGLRISAEAIKEMGLHPGDPVRVAFLTSDGVQNDFREFLISNGETDEADGPAEQINIPEHLLREANIPLEADLQVEET